MDEKLIGNRIKRLRQSKKITLESLAEMTGFTAGYISRIENSDKAPPISTLSKIATAFEMDISFLLAEGESGNTRKLVVTRKDDPKEPSDRKASYGYRYEPLARKKIGKNMEPYVLVPDSEYSTTFQHEGEEFFYVLEGKIEFLYGDQKYVLEAGDSMYFDADVPHSGISLGDARAKVLIVIYSYRRA